MYDDGDEETWSLEEVDKALKKSGVSLPPIKCLEAVAECPGYGPGTDFGLLSEFLPVPLNPLVSDIAVQKSLLSSVFKATVTMSAVLLLVETDEMSATEWLRLLVLLVMKCSTTEALQDMMSKLENEAFLKAGASSDGGKVKSIYDALPQVIEDEGDSDHENRTDSDVEQNVINHENEEKSLKSTADPKAEIGMYNSNDNSSKKSMNCINTEFGRNPELDVDASADGSGLPDADALMPSAFQSMEEVEKRRKLAALTAKVERQKAREDSIMAYCIKAQVKAAVSSFEEDNVSQVVDAVLTSRAEGLGFAASRCHGMKCAFCGLSDIALGASLVRTPNENEWKELMSHVLARRHCLLLAEIGHEPYSPQKVYGEMKGKPKVICVKVRVGGQLTSAKLNIRTDTDVAENTMLEFVPRNPLGFQHELMCRMYDDLPFITGSLSAHECCASAAHKSRSEIDALESQNGLDRGRLFKRRHTFVPHVLAACLEFDVSSSKHTIDIDGLATRWKR